MTTELMQFLLPYFEKLVLGLDIFAICLLIWGVCLSIKDFLKYLFVHTEAKNDRVSENNAIKKDVRRLYTPKFRNSCFGWDHRIDYQTYFAGYFPASCIGSYPNDHFLFFK